MLTVSDGRMSLCVQDQRNGAAGRFVLDVKDWSVGPQWRSQQRVLENRLPCSIIILVGHTVRQNTQGPCGSSC